MADRYWVGGSGTWDGTSTANWSTSSGGLSGASAPTASDNVIFDSGSGAPLTVNSGIAVNHSCLDLSINVSGVTIAGTGGGLNVSGNFTIDSGTTWSRAGTINFLATTSKTITTNGVTLSSAITCNGVGGTWTLGGAVTTNNAITLTNGTFDTGNYNVTCDGIISSNSNTRTLALGTSVITCVSTPVVNCGTTTNLTVTGSATIKCTRATAKTATLGGTTQWANTTLDQAGAGALTISGSNSLKNITNSYSATGATTITLTSGTTQTLTDFTASGAASKVLTLNTTTTSAATLSKSSGTVSVDYISISYSTATGGATWYAGANSTDGGNNTGWIFTAPPSTATGKFFMLFN